LEQFDVGGDVGWSGEGGGCGLCADRDGVVVVEVEAMAREDPDRGGPGMIPMRTLGLADFLTAGADLTIQQPARHLFYVLSVLVDRHGYGFQELIDVQVHIGVDEHVA